MIIIGISAVGSSSQLLHCTVLDLSEAATFQTIFRDVSDENVHFWFWLHADFNLQESTWLVPTRSPPYLLIVLQCN